MSKYKAIAKYFEESSHSKIYFESQSSAKALRQIRTIIDEHFPQMIFLLGSPGTGKTFLLNHLARCYGDEKQCLLMENPFLTPAELLKRMLSFMGISSDGKDVESMRLEAIEAYRDKPHIIMIDEAQLSHAPLREFIRILSDAKVFWFLVAMHTKEGESMLKNPHFFSRAHQIVYMGVLEKDEIMPYMSKVLKDCEYKDTVFMHKDLLINTAQRYAKGNFRNFKKLLFEFFLLLDYANENDRLSFTRPNKQVLTMAAIKAGLTNITKRSDFDELVALTSKKGSKKVILTALIIFLPLALLVWWADQKYNILDINNTFFDTKNSEKIANKNLHVKNKEQNIDKKDLHVKDKQIEKTSNVVQKETNETQTDKEIFQESEKLTFYPPNLDIKIKKKKKKVVKKKKHTDDEEVVSFDTSLKLEPKFLDEEVKYRQNKPILKVTKVRKNIIKSLEKEYISSPKYETALEIAKLYYEKKAYQNASIWSKKANALSSQEELPWILYAKSQYKMGNKKDAIDSLKLFLQYKYSQKVQNLLDKWSKDKR